jgi:hypothetical protein
MQNIVLLAHLYEELFVVLKFESYERNCHVLVEVNVPLFLIIVNSRLLFLMRTI